MSATATQQPPSVPPRPSRSQEKASIPMIPPRPINRRIERSMSPGSDRFAPSPLNENPLSSKKRANGNGYYGDIDRSKSVELPSVVGQEGMEYASLAEDLSSSREQTNSPEHTRTVGDDVKLHAPKPSLPAVSAKQRVMTITRTDSDRAASFGIGRPSSNDEPTTVLPSNRSLKKKASTTSQLSNTESHVDDEHGIPEIGQQVPMYPNAGDVQAPSPAPSSTNGDGPKSKHHARKGSARGIPPGSYGLHGHGVVPLDKLDKAYYEKRPDLLKKEITSHHHDRPNDFSMSGDDLNKIVRDTASRGSGLAVKNYAGTPSDQVAWQALEQTASRVTSPRPSSAEFKSSAQPTFVISDSDKDANGVIHVEEPGRRKSVMFSDGESHGSEDEEERPYRAPILAEDELAKDPSSYDHQPAVELAPERRGSAFEIEESTSRPTSRPASLYKEPLYEMRSTPLEDVEEYEPLFDEDDKEKAKEPVAKPTTAEKIKGEKKRRFPSADVWEDAPSSAHYTAEVSTPELLEEGTKSSAGVVPPPRDGETPAQAFARHQEELAEREVREHGQEAFLPGRKKEKPLWVQHQTHLASEPATRPSLGPRFPSRDVWEDAPDSLKLETTVSTPQQDDESSPVVSSPEIPLQPRGKSDAADKPAIPGRPKPRQASGDDSRPAIPERPKPQIPTRPAKAGPTSGGLAPAEAAASPRPKPAVPARPMGGKIAALQAGFMNDLNQRLRLGPQAPKKEEPAAEESPVEEKEKAPLVDARKGRARGPQRRAPAKSASPAPAPAPAPAAAAATKTEAAQPSLIFSQAITFFEVDPDEGVVIVGDKPAEAETDTEAGPSEEAEEGAVSNNAAVEKDEKKGAAAPEEKEAEKEKETEETAGEEPKSLVTNIAGETILEDHVNKGGKHLAVEPKYANE
ncbi:altered inheritance of mitochondria protein 21 [Lasiosphaeria hispida]|uniref:Altered inheritance of mitochondria protein 21 n=1 Tax=Lasiosphaeria hispida TaxID=260671 RepID=A0AAJ0MCX8_9PEZI|nr:altered inheritance of mitochondria protein 21 [Lasiosphaeria hispida]